MRVATMPALFVVGDDLHAWYRLLDSCVFVAIAVARMRTTAVSMMSAAAAKEIEAAVGRPAAVEVGRGKGRVVAVHACTPRPESAPATPSEGTIMRPCQTKRIRTNARRVRRRV